MAARVSVASESSGSRSLQPTTSPHDLIKFVQNSLAANAGSGVSKPGSRDAAIDNNRRGEGRGDGVGGREPPTEPRLMRRNITPPPQQKTTAYRPIDRRTQHDLYRPSSYRPADDISRGRRISISDTWRPGPFHYADATARDSELKSPSSRPSEHMNGARVRRSQRNRESSPVRLDDHGEESPSLSKAQVVSESHMAQRASTVNGQNATAPEMTMKAILEGRRISDDPVRYSAASSIASLGLDNVGYRKEEINPGTVDDPHGHSTQKGSHELSNDGESATTSSLALPSSDLNLEVNAAAQTTDFTLTLAQRLSSVDAASSSYLRSLKDMSTPFDKNSVVGASKLSRFSNEETASNSSTTNSRNKSLCRECHTPGSFLTPLVSCTSCGRGYHHSCGNPKPPKSVNEFVCGKCLKRKGLVRANGEQSRSASLNTGPITSSTSIKIDSVPKLVEVQLQSHPNSNNQDHHITQTQSSQGDLYKWLTCPFWKQGRCNFYEDHCLFAHVDTGHEAPSGRSRAKAFTCPTWKAGHCSKSSDQCLYSHKDTGLYVGFNHNVLRKHITCYYWKVAGSCRHYEEDCPYAHRDTGILAWQPGKDARSAPKENSLKNYICPRWEKNEPCRWYPSDCPYSHSSTAKSCLPSATDSHMNTRQIESSPDLTTQLSPTLASPSTSVPQKIPIPSMDDFRESEDPRGPEIPRTPENMHKDVQTVKIHSLTATHGSNSVIASDNSGHASICDDPSGIGHHSQAGRHMAKRGGRTSRTLTSNARSGNVSNHLRKPPLQHQPDHDILNAVGEFSTRSSMADAQISTDKEQDSSRWGDNTIAKSPTENGVKKCERCERRILGSANRCVACAATDDIQYEDGARAPKSMSKEIDTARTESAIPRADTAQQKSEKDHGLDELSRRLVANVRKRVAQDDNLFVTRKKSKMSTLPVNAQTRPLAASTNNLAVPPTTQANEEELFARIQPSTAISTGISSLQKQLPLHEEGDSRAESIVPVMENQAVSAQRQSPQPYNLYDTLSDASYNQQARGSNQSADHGTGWSSPISENLTKDAMSQSEVIDTSKRPSGTIHPPTLRSAITRMMEKESARGHEKTRESAEVSAKFAVSDNQQGRTRTVRETFVNDSFTQEDSVESTANGRVTLSARTAERSSSMSISDRVEPIYAFIKAADMPTSTLKSRCKACITAHRKCLHRLGGARDELDPLKCMAFLQENPERPLNGKFSESYWLKIKQVARFGHQDGNSLSALKYKDATRVAIALSVTEGSDESMADETGSLAAGQGMTREQVAKAGLTSTFHFDHPRLRSQARAATTVDEHLRQSEEESDDDLPLAITRTRHQSNILARPLRPTTAPTGSALRTSKEKIGRMNTLPARVNGAQRPHPQLSKTQPIWSNEDEQRALEKLRERGVEIETDSDSDESFSDDDIPRQAPPLVTDPLRRIVESQNPFDVDPSLDLRNPENRYQALGITPPWKRNRPTKKQLMGNLLLYQCRDNKLKYGNPHYRVMRKSAEVPVTAIIENDDIFSTPDEMSGHEPDKRHVPMTFREFIGMPKQPIIVQGKTKDELVFVEGLSDKDRSSSGMSRTRRYRDDEIFPFVYT